MPTLIEQIKEKEIDPIKEIKEKKVKKKKKEKTQKDEPELSTKVEKKKRKASDSDEDKKSKKKKKKESKKEVAEEVETKDPMSIYSFPLSDTTRESLKHRGIETLFPIQAASFQHIFEGKDFVGRARTGTGKTLAFSLPMVERLKQLASSDSSVFKQRARAPRVLIMTPTRELANQVNKEFESIVSNGIKTVCIYGGVPYDSQYTALKSGVDVVIGTPGRLIDHVERGNLKLHNLMFVCMDEADQMLDIGFADNMDHILKQIGIQKKESNSECPELQTLLFSATMPEWIKQAIQKYMNKDKVSVDLIGNEKLKTSESVKHYCIPSHWQSRAQILGDIVTVYGRGKQGKTIIFVETKGEANELVLNEKLKDSQVIHGDIVQKQRETAMQGFRDGKIKCLIATNVCARGVDIPEVDLVINSEPPGDVETYIHRSGRTGRAGKSGVCVTFYKPQQEYLVNQITRRAGVQFTRIGAPQPTEIIAAHAQETVDNVEKVHPKAMSYFTSTAQKILSTFSNDAQKAVEACLAMICNTTSPLPPRSLLSANEGFLTLLFQVDHQIRNVGYIRSVLQRNFPGLTYDDTRGWRMTADETGVVVDVTSNKVEVVQSEEGDKIVIDGKKWTDERGITCQVPKVIPELKEAVNQNSGNQRNFGNQRGYGNNRNGNGRDFKRQGNRFNNRR